MIGMAIKRLRFNAPLVINRARNAARPVLARQGAYLRGIARRLIRRRTSGVVALPGQPPYTHTGALKRSIMFAAGSDSVVIGPTHSGIGRIGHTHEFGGVEAAVASRNRKANWQLMIGGHGPIDVDASGDPVVAKLRTTAQVRRARKLARTFPHSVVPGKPKRRYPARPFMGPALRAATPELPSFWKDALRKTA